MRIRSIISIIAFVAAFALSSSLALLLHGKPAYQSRLSVTSCGHHRAVAPEFNSRLQREISEFIQQDIDNGRTRQDRVTQGDDFNLSSADSLAEYAGAVKEYVAASGRLDDSALPREFQTAWRAHLKAWQVHSEFLNNFKKRGQGFSTANSGDLKLYAEQSDEISATWHEVKRIAASYDATDFVE
jgi:hypothetical protein